MSLQQEVIIRDGKIVGSPPIATPSVNKALATDSNGNIVGSAVSKSTLEELNMLITDTTGQDIVDGLSALASAVKPSAVNIPYSNTSSGLSANDVQGAIDEVAQLIKYKVVTVTTSQYGTANLDMNINTQPIIAVACVDSVGKYTVMRLNVNQTQWIKLYDVGSSNIAIAPNITINLRIYYYEP